VLAAEGVEPPETILAEGGDPSSLRAMASRAIVVLNLVGPYMLYGESVIEACVDAGCHYVDLTGEIRGVGKAATRKYKRHTCWSRTRRPAVIDSPVPGPRCPARPRSES
jgi:saccharopine dehydrogenase-like NADP-dependent oxidoreductase